MLCYIYFKCDMHISAVWFYSSFPKNAFKYLEERSHYKWTSNIDLMVAVSKHGICGFKFENND